ncbi:trypsin-like peptidase domain-containing protein [Hydrogenibacillus sp. N12]|uniref:S1C family serine protease n=1 Tax=Hydrogenibacillus sp. N12 TaxID=2866627 RepID=UPI001C7D54C9|nr:trypsin-like peptidase domain-containing protein [Hydrogenibacillus sp. N12]QZA32998.1 trypsin-like peptidase domain-containing protein [Hydrogenibacillus sp. N12]
MDPYRVFDDRRRPHRSGFWPVLFGAAVGAAVTAAVMAAALERLPAPGPAPMAPREAPAVPSRMRVEVTSAVSDVVERTEVGVVGVVNLAEQPGFWERRTAPLLQGTGSGIIFADDGRSLFVATNHHVIEGAGAVEVVFPDGSRAPATVRGADRLSDLAVLQVSRPAGPYAVLPFGDSDRLRVGEPAIAIGNPLGLEYSRTVTVGVISATNRSIPVDLAGDGHVDWELDVVQTDAAINPGNSGGALLNIAGQVIGISSAKISEVGVEGIGFAIPSNFARPVLEALATAGRVVRPYLGIGVKDLQEFSSDDWATTLRLPRGVTEGVVLVDVAPGSPAAGAGLKELDVIVALDGQPTPTGAVLRKWLYTKKRPGDAVRIAFFRDGVRREATAVLGTMP